MYVPAIITAILIPVPNSVLFIFGILLTPYAFLICNIFNGIVANLLNIMDGIIAGQNIIFLSSNEISHLDSALIRPGRVDRIEKFDYSVKEQILEIFSVFTENEEKAINFYTELCKYNIKVSTSLLQQYLLKYQFNPDGAIENLDEIKKMYDSCNVNKEAEHVYS